MSGRIRKVLRAAALFLVIVSTLIFAGCESFSSPVPEGAWSVVFGSNFMDAAQTTPEEWAAYLEERGPDYIGSIEVSGSKVRLVDNDGYSKWAYWAEQELAALKSEFTSVPERCSVEYWDSYTLPTFYYDHSVYPEVDENILRRAKTWCAFMRLAYYGDSDSTLDDIQVQNIDCHRITVEDVMAISDLTEEDFAGIDPVDFFDTMGIYSHNLEEDINLIPRLLEFYREDLDTVPGINYELIYTMAYGRLTEEDIDNVEVVLCSYHDGSYNEYIAIDLVTGNVYSSMRDFFDNCTDSYLSCRLTPEGKQWVKDLLIHYKVASWGNRYEGTSEGTTGHFGVSFAFRLADGHCVKYGAGGVMNSGMPREMPALQQTLSEQFFEKN